MDLMIVEQHLESYKQHIAMHSREYEEDLAERKRRCDYYQGWTRERILHMTETDLFQYISKLWAILIWGNKRYLLDKMIQDNSFDCLRRSIAELQWGQEPVPVRWDCFKDKIKGFGPAMMSELLCYVYPSECMIWNRRSSLGLSHLGVKSLPAYNYQLTGRKYAELSQEAQKISLVMKDAGLQDATLLTVDCLILFRPPISWSARMGRSWFKEV